MKKDIKQSVITFLDGKRAQAIGIGIQKMRLPLEQLIEKIKKMESISEIDSGVDTLVACCPSQDDIDQAAEKL